MSSVVQSCNALTPVQNGKQLQEILASILTDLEAIAAALVSLTGQMDTNLLTGHPYTKAANNPTLVTTA